MSENLIHTDSAHIVQLLPEPPTDADLAVITRGLQQFVQEQDFQQSIDQEILRIYHDRNHQNVPEQAIIWTDGSCLKNPGPGGWAYVITGPDHHTLAEQSGHEPETTNNRMELTAIAEAIETTAGRYRKITIWSDSKYAVDTFNKSWIRNWERNGWLTYNRQPVKNQDLWHRICRAMAGGTTEVQFKWVKGHAGHPGNERADRLASAAAASRR